MLKPPPTLDSHWIWCHILVFHSGLQNDLPYHGLWATATSTSATDRGQGLGLGPTEGLASVKARRFRWGFRDRGPAIFSACLSERKTWLSTLQGLGKEIRFEPCIFFYPANVLENMKYVGFLACILFKRFQLTASTYAGCCFRLQICGAKQLALPCSTFFEPFGYVDGRCRKCRSSGIPLVRGKSLVGHQRLSTKPFLVENLRKQSSSWNLSQPFRAIFFQQKQEHEITNHPFSGIISAYRCPLKRRLRFLA